MIRIAIVDDDIYVGSKIEKMLITYSSVSTYDFKIDVFQSGEELCKHMINEQKFDLVFLDIEMYGCNGIEVGRIIRDELKDDITQIVYITARDGYERQLFKVRPLDFIKKPFTESVIVNVVDTYLRLHSQMNELFEFICERQKVKIPCKDILYFHSVDKKVNVYTNKTVMGFYGKLSDISDNLPHEFMIIHQSYIINKVYAEKYSYESVTMINGQQLPISQNYRKNVKRLISLKRDMGKEFFHV